MWVSADPAAGPRAIRAIPKHVTFSGGEPAVPPTCKSSRNPLRRNGLVELTGPGTLSRFRSGPKRPQGPGSRNRAPDSAGGDAGGHQSIGSLQGMRVPGEVTAGPGTSPPPG